MADTVEKFYVSNSSMNSAQSCKRKFFYQKLWTRSSYEKSMAASAGSAIHEAYFSYMVDRAKGELTEDQARQRAIWILFKEYPWEIMVWGQDVSRTFNDCLDALRCLIQNPFSARYELIQLEHADGRKVWSREVAFEIELKGIEIAGKPAYYMGYIDMILWDKIQREYVVVDLKTSNDTSLQTASYIFDAQTMGYGFPIAQTLGVPIDSFRTGYLTQAVKVGSDWKKPFMFQRSKEDYLNWVMQLVIQCRDLQKHYENGWWPKTLTSCMGWRQPCKWVAICKQSTFDKAKEVSKPRVESLEAAKHMQGFDPVIKLTIDANDFVF